MNKDNIKTEILSKNRKIGVLRIVNKEYISLTDLVRYVDNEEHRLKIRDWMRSKEVISYLELWEIIHNENFKRGEFDTFKNEAGSNTFKLKSVDMDGVITDYNYVKKLEFRNRCILRFYFT